MSELNSNPLLNKKKILYFIKSYYPTEAEAAHALSIGATAFRNAGKDDGVQLEEANGVAGLVPQQFYTDEGKKVAKIIKGEDYDPDATDEKKGKKKVEQDPPK